MITNPHDDKHYWAGFRDGVEERDRQWLKALHESGALPSDLSIEEHLDPSPRQGGSRTTMSIKEFQLLSICTVAGTLGVSPQTLRRNMHKWDLHPVVLGRRVLIREDEVRALIAKAQRNPPIT